MAKGVRVRYFEASELAGPLRETSHPVFYTHTLCPYAHRVWMTLLEKASGRCSLS